MAVRWLLSHQVDGPCGRFSVSGSKTLFCTGMVCGMIRSKIERILEETFAIVHGLLCARLRDARAGTRH